MKKSTILLSIFALSFLLLGAGDAQAWWGSSTSWSKPTYYTELPTVYSSTSYNQNYGYGGYNNDYYGRNVIYQTPVAPPTMNYNNYNYYNSYNYNNRDSGYNYDWNTNYKRNNYYEHGYFYNQNPGWY